MDTYQVYREAGNRIHSTSRQPGSMGVQSESERTFAASYSLNEDESENSSFQGSQAFLGISDHGSIATRVVPEFKKVTTAVQGNMRVSLARTAVLLVLILGTVGQSVIQYITAVQVETVAFEEAFHEQALQLLAVWTARLNDDGGEVASWQSFFEKGFSSSPIVVVVDDRCGDDTLSFELYGSTTEKLGLGDLLEPGLAKLGLSEAVANCTNEAGNRDSSQVIVSMYPTPEMRDSYVTDRPKYNLALSLIIGFIVLLLFVIYDFVARKRYDAIDANFQRSQEILSSLFPANVQDRLFSTQMEASVHHFDLDNLQTPPLRQKSVVQMPNTILEGPDEGDPILTMQSQSPMDVVTPTPNIEARKPTASQRLQMFLSPPLVSPSSDRALASKSSEPIADLFPEATVMFADISGFTAWSSEREPAQVFKLLETIYHAFDKVANKRRVFKVETIGDSYVAVTGLPDPMKDHAVVMTKFANECRFKMNGLTRKLELVLGPGTAELCMRFGLHSGPVTAGVLRGKKSRFQLFGDAVNFASRMESTGKKNRIQVSQASADLLLAAGLSHWLHPREDLVNAKGKGAVQTYWVSLRSASGRSSGFSGSDHQLRTEPSDSSLVELKSKRKISLHRDGSKKRSDSLSSSDNDERRNLLNESFHSHNRWSTDSQRNDLICNVVDLDDNVGGMHEIGRQARLIDWNTEVLGNLLKRIVFYRKQKGVKDSGVEDAVLDLFHGKNFLEEITEIIPLFSTVEEGEDYLDASLDNIQLPSTVERQLREYVTMIACMYRDNPFHNFEHASHVLMTSQKLLRRVLIAGQESSQSDYTRGITSDPLTQFAIVFSALIHDVDHTGVPNSQLVKEKAHIASLYDNKSVAEQNSLDLAWELLMDPSYQDLQRCIFSNKAELVRFRQLIVNVILATDIFDPDMRAVRNSRFAKAFQQESSGVSLNMEEEMNLKATIVIEYVMQASDVSHTMQHWHVYQRWNERLFAEMYSAWHADRLGFDPSIGWYEGELSFFDNYIIPLAKKLKDCQVFGAASSEFLKYALENRKEWAEKGEKLLDGYKVNYAKW